MMSKASYSAATRSFAVFLVARSARANRCSRVPWCIRGPLVALDLLDRRRALEQSRMEP
jgi:hypothetical protein